MKDLAQVSVGAVPRQGIVGQDEDDEAVTGIVLMRKGGNPSEVLTALKEKVAALNRSVLPKGVQVVPFYDRTWLIHTTLKTVFKNLLEGALLVTCVLYLFLGNVRAAGIVAVMLPLSFLATFMGLRLRGIPANLLSLGAMDFGIIVDGAVIVVANVGIRLTRDSWNTTVVTQKRTEYPSLEAPALSCGCAPLMTRAHLLRLACAFSVAIVSRVDIVVCQKFWVLHTRACEPAPFRMHEARRGPVPEKRRSEGATRSTAGVW